MQNKVLLKLNKIKMFLGFVVFLVLIIRKCFVKVLEIKVFLNLKDSRNGRYKFGFLR